MKTEELELLWCMSKQGFMKEYEDFMQYLVLKYFDNFLREKKK